MKLTLLNFALFSILFVGITSCSESKMTDESNSKDEISEQVEETKTPETEEIIEDSPLGNFEGLVGEWFVDAATAGVKLNLTFGEDGSFSQVMGQVNGKGTWEIIDDEHIKIVTQNTKGQTWKITDLKETTVNLCWNPEKPNPKILPMKRIK